MSARSPPGKPGRDHDELRGLICDRSVMALAVAQQFPIAPGAALPAMTASPVGSMRAMSKTGTDSSVSGERGDTAAAAATAFASACAVASAAEASSRASGAGGETAGVEVAVLVSTGGSRCRYVMPRTGAAPHAATSASTTIRTIDVAVMVRDRWPDRWFVSTPGAQDNGGHRCPAGPLGTCPGNRRLPRSARRACQKGEGRPIGKRQI
jgi:hypothetical protein